MAAYRRVYDTSCITCRLTAKNRDQLRNPTLGNRVWATFTFLLHCNVVVRRLTPLPSRIGCIAFQTTSGESIVQEGCRKRNLQCGRLS